MSKEAEKVGVRNMTRIIALDCDGTLFERAYPEIGKPIPDVLARAIQAQNEGAKLILWTSRTGTQLKEAVQWCEDHGLHFSAINDNLPEIIARFNGNPRKIFASEYWDDRNVILHERSCMNCAGLKYTNSSKNKVFPWCSNNCKNFRLKEEAGFDAM